jgi:uncharacterized repeat protein (TIGR01451 family)
MRHAMLAAAWLVAAAAYAGDVATSIPATDTHLTEVGSRLPADASHDPPLPNVAVRVRVPDSAKTGEELTYHLCVENASKGEAYHVTVRCPLPGNAKFVRADPPPSDKNKELIWRLDTMPPMTYRDITLVLLPTGPGEVRACARIQYEHGQCVCTKVTGPALKLVAQGPAQVVVGEPATLRLTVENTGNDEAADVKLKETLPPGLIVVGGKTLFESNVGTLAAGQSRTVEFKATASDAGKLCTKAQATGAGGVHAEAERCLHAGQPKLTLAESGPSHRYLNLSATYRITIANPGDMAVESIVVKNALPPQTIFMSASEGAELVGNEVHWTIANLQAGGEKTLELVLRSQNAQEVCNRTQAQGAHGLQAQAEACTSFLGVSAVLLELTDSDDPIELGAETSYSVVIRNQGTVPVTQARLLARAGPHLEIARVSGPADSHRDGATVTSDPFVIQPDSEVQFLFRVRALRVGDARFKVDLSADQLTAGPVREEESTQVYADAP